MGYTIKRGVTFRIAVVLSEDQWSAVYPWVSVSSSIKQGSRRTNFNVSVDASVRTITLTATPEQTSLFAVGVPAEIDVWIDRGGAVVSIPYAQNVRVNVIDGATQ